MTFHVFSLYFSKNIQGGSDALLRSALFEKKKKKLFLDLSQKCQKQLQVPFWIIQVPFC